MSMPISCKDNSEPFLSLSPGKYTIVRAQGQDIGTHSYPGKGSQTSYYQGLFQAVTLTNRIKVVMFQKYQIPKADLMVMINLLLCHVSNW